MDSKLQLPGIRGYTFALVAGFILLTAHTVFAQGAVQSDVDALKARMDQMQKQFEQRIEQMGHERAQNKRRISELQAEIKVLESKAASCSSFLNTQVLAEASRHRPKLFRPKESPKPGITKEIPTT